MSVSDKGKEQSLPKKEGDLNSSAELPSPIPAIRLTTPSSNTDWLSELGDEANIKSDPMSKTQYIHLCNDVKTCLDGLLSEGKTPALATISKLFKSFRSAFGISQKLKNKVYELESEKRMKERIGASVLDQIESRNEKIKYLEDHLVEAEIKRTEAEKSLQEAQSRLQEMRKKSEGSDKNSEVFFLFNHNQ